MPRFVFLKVKFFNESFLVRQFLARHLIIRLSRYLTC